VVLFIFYLLQCSNQASITINSMADPYTFIPTTASSIEMISCSSSSKNHSLRIDLCSPESYHNCRMVAESNIPDNEHSVPNGIWVEFLVLSQSDSCGNVLCQNNINSLVDPNSCSFIYNKALGSTLFVNLGCGGQSNMDYNFNLRIYCGNATMNMQQNDYFIQPKSRAMCPTTYDNTKQTAKMETIQSVFTTVLTTQAKLYQIIICGQPQQKVTLDLSITGVDKYSAFTTYVCPTADCNAGHLIPGWYDDSGANFNHITIRDLKPTTLYFRVYGRGLWNHMNNFTVSADMRSGI